jgi:RNA polymerase sigma-70 factor (ECF subfamily)
MRGALVERGMEEPPVESRLLEACRSGDREAFRRLFDIHKDRVYSVALHHLRGDAAAAEDVTQQVFIALFRRIDQFRGEAEFTTWLHRLVVNACLDEWKRRGRLTGGSERRGPNPAPASPETALVEGERAAVVRKALFVLRPKIRLAVLLKYFLDLSYDEMAKALGCSKGTVASRLNTGHRILARRLSRLRRSVDREVPR